MSNLHRFSVAIVIGLVCIASAGLKGLAQAPGSSRGAASGDGNNMITGRVHFPPGQTVDSKTVKVNLESVSAFGSMNAVTDQDGAFRFRGLNPGTYTVVVDAGKEYEVAREAVNIERQTSAGGRTIQVNIILRPRVDSSNPLFANIPAAALADYQKGTAAAKKGNPKEAAEFLNKAVTTYPNFPIALNELGIQYMQLTEWDKAADTYDQLLKLKPKDAAAHLNMGIARFNQKKYDDAQGHLREALKLNSNGPSAHYYLGLTLVSLKQYAEAESEFEKTISNGGENLPLAHKYLGGLYMSSKKNQQAADELEKYLKLDPKANDAERIRGTIKQLRQNQ